MRICLVYDCLYPQTVGGAERWYRNLALRLAEAGHDVTYLTMRQWDEAEKPDISGVRVVAVAPRMALYTGGRRRILPPLIFGIGILWHLRRNGRRYDVVHTASFPYFSLLAAALGRRSGGYRLMVDWHELWTREYWGEYLGLLGGALGWRVQQRCLSVRQHAFCFSRLIEQRLLAEGVNGHVSVLEGQFEGTAAAEPLPAESVVIFAGRHIPEKDPVAVVAAVARARERIPDLRAAIYGDGPERSRVLAAIAEHGVEQVIEAPGFVDGSTIESALSRALCLVLPSRREGYGLVVLEATSRGTPVILVSGADNAAAELVVDGENGFVVPDPTADVLSSALVKAHSEGISLRARTLAHFKREAGRRSLESSIEAVLDAYTI
jgi:glycosyltransferase involved in cell wall biosynthesis